MIDQNDKEELMESYLTAQAAPVVAASELSDAQISAIYVEQTRLNGDTTAASVVAFARAVLAAATPAASVPAKPVAWIRFRSDGGYEGPIMDAAMEDVRKNSGAWTPLYAAPAVQQPAEGGWISVDERLPKEGAHVLIAYWPYDNHENEQAVMDAEYIDGTFYTDDGNETHPPSHWMQFPPLPAAPTQAEGQTND